MQFRGCLDVTSLTFFYAKVKIYIILQNIVQISQHTTEVCYCSNELQLLLDLNINLLSVLLLLVKKVKTAYES